jgi:hypothetical protein
MALMSTRDLMWPIGRGVALDLLLEWDLSLPTGTVTKMLKTDQDRIVGGSPHVYYLVELESPITFESPGKRFLRRKTGKKFTTKHVILEMRNLDRLREEFNGLDLSELTAPLLDYPKDEQALEKGELQVREDIEVLGPVRIRILGS